MRGIPYLNDAGIGQFVNDSADRLVGNPYLESNQVTSGDLFAGTWVDMLIMMWGGAELDIDLAAKFLSAGKRFRLIQSVDIDFTRVGSFTLGNDGV